MVRIGMGGSGALNLCPFLPIKKAQQNQGFAGLGMFWNLLGFR
jgi:hypothetical protein